MTRLYKAKLVTALSLLLFSCTIAAAELNADEQRMMAWIDANAEQAIELLEETVNISSGTMNHDGIRALGVEIGAVTVVHEPVDGCLLMARERLLNAAQSK